MSPVLRVHHSGGWVLAAMLLATLVAHPAPVAGWSLFGGGSTTKQPTAPTESDEQIDDSNLPAQIGIPQFEPGKQYSYKFDSQMASSLTGGEYFSVSRVSTNVKMQILDDSSGTPIPEGDKIIVMQCEQIQLAVSQQPISIPRLATTQQKLVEMDDLDAQSVAEKIQKAIQLPFQVRLAPSGRVKELRFSEEDADYSENIKRAIVNLIQVQQSRNQSSTDGSVSPAQEPDQAISYKLLEKTIEGECEVAYTVIPDDAQQESQQSPTAVRKVTATVTKAVNTKKCKRRPEIRYNFLRHSEDYTASNALEAGQTPYEKEAVEVMSVYEFRIAPPSSQQISSVPLTQRDDNDDGQAEPVITKAKAVSQLTYNLMDSARPALLTYASAQLTLSSVDGKNAGETWSTPANLKQWLSSLVHSVEADIAHERFIADGDGAYISPEKSPYPSTERLPDIAVNVMRELMESAQVGGTAKYLDMREEAINHLEQFVSVLRLCTQPQLREVRQKLAPLVQLNTEQTWKNSKFLRDIFSDALTMACTQPSIAEFHEIIKAKQVSPSKASRAIRQLMHCRLVGQTQLDQVWAIRDSEMAQKYSPLRRACTLTWATMAGAMCSSNTINATNVWQYEHPSQIDERRVPLDELIHPLGGHADSDKWAGESPVDGRGNPSASTACPKEKRQEFVDKLAKIYDEAQPQQRKDKIVSIKSLGNLGLATGLPVLKRIMHSDQEEPLIKVQAIDAVRHIAHKRPDAVQHALLPLFQDRSQPEEVRLNAFYQLLHAQPDPQMMEVVCREMQAEQNQHVKAFVQTAITNMADSRKHFDQKTASVLEAALEKLKAYSGAYDEEAEARSASQLHQFAVFSGDYTYTLSPRGTGHTEFGAGITTTAIYGKESALLPKEITMAVDTLFDGRLTGDVAQISIQQQDLELGLQRIAEQIDAKNFDQVVTRSRRAIGPLRQGEQQTFNPYESVKQWLAKHRPNFMASNSNGNATNANGSKKEPLVLITARAYGQDIDFQLIDQSAFDRFIVNGRLDVAGWESSKNTTDNFHHHYAATLGPEFKLKVPSVAGIPVVVSKTVPAMTACEGTTKLEFSPSGQTDKVRGVKYTATMQSQAAVATVYRMEAFSPLFTCGVNTRHSQVFKIPLNFQLKIGRGEGVHPIPSAELELRLPQEDLLLAQSSTRPSTFTRVWPANGQYPQDKFLARSEYTLYLSETENDQVDRTYRFTCPLSGLVVETHGHWPRRARDAHGDAQWIVGGENSMEVRVLPSQSPNAAGRLRFKLQLQQSSSEDPINKQELTNLFDTQKELFADSSPEEKQLVKQFISEFNPRHANIATRMRFTAMADQFAAPQQRGGVVELTTFCDKRFYLCSASGKADWKSGPADGAKMQNAMAVSQQRGGRGGGNPEPYEISIRSSAQITMPVLKGVFVGGIRSEHLLAHIQATVTGTDFNSPLRATLNLYAKPSRRAVMAWQMLLDEARQAGIVEFEGGMPKVLMFNDITAVAEFQSSSPAKAWLRPALHEAKNYPQSYVQIEPNLDGEDEDELEDDSQQQQGSQQEKVQIYARLIADELVIAGQPAMLYNLTVRSRPVPAGAGEQVGNYPRRRGDSHFRLSNRHKFDRIDDDSNGGSAENQSSSNKRRSPRRNINSSPRASLFDVFKSGGNSRRAQMAQCQMSQGRYVKSFDGKNYVIPLRTDCYTVMAKECGHGSSRQPAFSIMAKKTGPSSNPDQQRIHLLLKLAKPQRQYELYLSPSAGQHQHQNNNRQHQQPQMVIKLDGEVLREEDYEVNDISVIDPNEGGQGRNQRRSLKVYILHCSTTGAELQFNGEQFVIRLPQRYTNKQCGVCGHYNMDSGDELMTEGSGGRRQQASSLADFHASYLHNGQQQGQQKHGECDPNAVAAKIRQQRGGQSREDTQQQGGQSNEDQQQQRDDAYSFKKKPKKTTQWMSSQEDPNTQSTNNNANSGEEGSTNTVTNADNFFNDQVLGTNRQWDESDENQEPYWPQEENDQSPNRNRGQSVEVQARNATKVVESHSMVCFSAKPVPTCPPGSEPAPGQSEKKRIVFLCLPRYHSQVRQWMKAVRSAPGGITKLDVRGMAKQQIGGRYDEQESYNKTEWVPKKCVQAASTGNGWGSSSSTEY